MHILCIFDLLCIIKKLLILIQYLSFYSISRLILMLEDLLKNHLYCQIKIHNAYSMHFWPIVHNKEVVNIWYCFYSISRLIWMLEDLLKNHLYFQIKIHNPCSMHIWPILHNKEVVNIWYCFTIYRIFFYLFIILLGSWNK